MKSRSGRPASAAWMCRCCNREVASGSYPRLYRKTRGLADDCFTVPVTSTSTNPALQVGRIPALRDLVFPDNRRGPPSAWSRAPRYRCGGHAIHIVLRACLALPGMRRGSVPRSPVQTVPKGSAAGRFLPLLWPRFGRAECTGSGTCADAVKRIEWRAGLRERLVDNETPERGKVYEARGERGTMVL
jgi:hypothetical protein